MTIDYKINNGETLSYLNAGEFIELLDAVGWGSKSEYDKAAVFGALISSSGVFTARNKSGHLIGYARVISDNNLYTCVPEIIVHPKWQNKGIGRKIIELISTKYKNTSIFISSFNKNSEFFCENGFSKQDSMCVVSRSAA